MSDQPTISLSQYRRVIREEWLPVVGRKKMTSFEYTLTEQWWKNGTPLSWILRAIRDVKGRCTTLYSIGVIRADLERIGRQQATLNVGRHYEPTDEKWRETFAECLDECAEYEEAHGNENLAAQMKELKGQLPGLSKDEASGRWALMMTTQSEPSHLLELPRLPK